MDDKRQVTLPDSLMEAIAAVTNSQNMTPNHKLEAVVLMTHGYGLWSRETDQFDPTSYAIPAFQWRTIADLLMGASEPIDGVNYALSWMNYGPSGFEQED